MEQLNYKSIGIGITTYNAPSRLHSLLETLPDFIENVIIVNDGTPMIILFIKINMMYYSILKIKE